MEVNLPMGRSNIAGLLILAPLFLILMPKPSNGDKPPPTDGNGMVDFAFQGTWYSIPRMVYDAIQEIYASVQDPFEQIRQIGILLAPYGYRTPPREPSPPEDQEPSFPEEPSPELEQARVEAREVIEDLPVLKATLSKPIEEFRPEETAAVLQLPVLVEKGVEVIGFEQGLLGGTGIDKPLPVIFPTYTPAQQRRETQKLEYYYDQWGNQRARWVPI